MWIERENSHHVIHLPGEGRYNYRIGTDEYPDGNYLCGNLNLSMKRFFFPLILVFVSGVWSISCDHNTSEIDQLDREVMLIHDEVMPMISDMVKVRRSLEDRLTDQDSTTQMARKNAIAALKEAEKGMWDWMAQYRKPKTGDADAVEYLASQKAAIQSVSDAMKTAYTNGQNMLK